MEKTDRYRQLLIEIISQFNYESEDVERRPIYDIERDRYQMMSVGWNDSYRIYGTLVHADIIDGKIWIQWDGTEVGIANELVAQGVPKSDIVLAWQSPTLRRLGEFAVA